MKELAAHIVDSKASHFDPSTFEDHYETALVELLRAKQAGRMVEPPKEEAAPQRVINLMDALRASIGAETKKKPAAASTKARARADTAGQEENGTLKQNAEPDRAALEGTVAFTGRLASMKRADAFALVRKHGGKPREGVTRQTDVLIVGELGWPLLDDGRPSNSLAQAKSYEIPIASERQFLEWVGQNPPAEQAKTYTADQLAKLEQAAEGGRRPARHVRPDRGPRRSVTAFAISRRRARSRGCWPPERGFR